MNFLKSTYLRSAIIWLSYITLFLGSYVATSLFFPYITGKNFAFRTIVEITAVLYITLAVSDKKYRPRKNLAINIYLGFIAVLFIADIFGVNPMNSLWSNFERMEGFITHIHLFIYTAILVFLRLKKDEWINFLKVFLVGNAAVIFFAYLEIIKISNQLAAGQPVGTRIAGTLGNPAYLAIVSAFGFFVAILLYLLRKEKAEIIEKTLYIASALLNLFIIWRSETRGTLVGLAAGFVSAALYLAFIKRKNKKIQKLSLLFLGLVLMIVLGISSLKDSNLATVSPTLKRLSDISLNEQTVRSRFMIWNMSLEAAKHRPLLGYGQDNFIYPFSKYYNPNMFDQEQWFDRSHNVFLDWLIAGGILTLVLYLAMFGVTVYTAIKSQVLDEYQKATIIALLVTYFVHNVFVFDNLISYICFFLFFAFINSSGEQDDEKQKSKSYISSNSTALIVFTISTVIMFIFWNKTVYGPYSLNSDITKMYLSVVDQSKENLEKQITNLSRTELYGTHEAREQLFTLGGVISNSKTLSDDDKQYLAKEIISLGLSEVKSDPENPRPAVIMAGYLTGEDAVLLYKRALEVTPNKVYLWLNLASAYLNIDDTDNAILAAKTSHELAKRSIQSTLVLSSIYYKIGQKQLAENVWQETILANNKSQEVYIKRAAFYKDQKDDEMFKSAKQDLKDNFPEISDQVDEAFN